MTPGRDAGRSTWVRPLLGLAALALLYGVDLHLDARGRDAFSWMDPEQYFEFALGVLEGRERIDGFEVPSIFPFFLIPFLALEPSLPAALHVNLAATGLLLLGIAALCKQLRIATPWPLVAGLVLSSPLLIGLSRTLYIEYTLTGIVAAAFSIWLRLHEKPTYTTALLFAAVLTVGTMTKMTFPAFLLLPMGACVLDRLASRRVREACILAASALGPIALVGLVQMTLFSGSFHYYLNLGNTTLPIGYLIGPDDSFSWTGATYSFREIGRSGLFLLTPLLGVSVWSMARSRQRLGRLGNDVMLWLWLLGAPLILILPSVKEPRHLAPCVVPAVMLIVQGIEAIPARSVRVGLLALALILGAAQYAAVTLRIIDTPYFMDRPLQIDRIETAMMSADGHTPDRSPSPRLRALRWKYDQNVAIAGFQPNEALALTWWAFPGVVYDLDTFDPPQRKVPGIADQRLEDLYLLVAFNTYNRRIGFHRYHETLNHEEVVANADFLILNVEPGGDGSARFPEHVEIAAIERGDRVIRILRRRGADGLPYRALYDHAFLDRHPDLLEDELRVVVRDLLLTAILAGDDVEVQALMQAFPIIRSPAAEIRNIYWIGGYPALIDLAQQRLRAALVREGGRRRTSRGEAESRP